MSTDPTETIELMEPTFEDFKRAHESITTAEPKIVFANVINGRRFESVVLWHGFPVHHPALRTQDIEDQWQMYQARLERTKRRVAA